MADIGEIAPDFALPAQNGQTVTLSGLRGQKVVLYFYPRDNTTGCTNEAIDFTAAAAEFAAAGATIVGVSRDSVKSHEKFAARHDLGITLCADEDGAVCNAYGVWTEKSMYGRKFMGIERTTFLIDATGQIAQVWHKVRVKGHVAEVLSAARAL